MLEECQCSFGESLSAGISFGRGTGPGYYHAPVPKPTFPQYPPTQFTPNEKALVAESPDMFYGLDGLGLTELSVEPYMEAKSYQFAGGVMLDRIDPMPTTGASTIFARADHDLVGPAVAWGTGRATLNGLGGMRVGRKTIQMTAREFQELVAAAGGKIRADGVWGPGSMRALAALASRLEDERVTVSQLRTIVAPYARGRAVLVKASVVEALAGHIGLRAGGGTTELGAVRWPATRMGAPRTAYVPRPTFAPVPRLAPMVSPASLARARKRQAGQRALRRRRTAQIKGAHKATRAAARWR
jgi:hypothetical protein